LQPAVPFPQSSAIGICDQIAAAMVTEGATSSAARDCLWLVDSHGLVHTGRSDLDAFKQKYAQPIDATSQWTRDDPLHLRLIDVIRNVHPTILIVTSSQTGAFTEEIVL
jgi:malate dehydrogenase (oxaloacetate-decarboxylating)